MTGTFFLRYKAFLLAIGAVIGVVAVVVVARSQFIDLQVYRFGAQALWRGDDPYGTLPPTSAGVTLPFIYPPFAAIALTPLVTAPWWCAAVGMFALSVAALGLALVVTVRLALPWRRVVVGLALLPAALLLEPVRATLGFGQVNLVLMGMVLADCLLPKTRWPRGTLVGLAAAVKITPAAFVLFFLLRKDFRSATTAAATALAASAAGFVVAPVASAHYWLVELTGASGLSGSPFATNQTIEAELTRLGLPPGWHAVLGAVLVAAVLVAAVIVMRRVEPPVAVLVNAVAALVVSPISWSHHWVWLAPALVVLCGHACRTGAPRWWVAAGALAVVFFVGPHHFAPSGEDKERHWTLAEHLYGNTYLLLALCVLAGWAWWLKVRCHRVGKELLRALPSRAEQLFSTASGRDREGRGGLRCATQDADLAGEHHRERHQEEEQRHPVPTEPGFRHELAEGHRERVDVLEQPDEHDPGDEDDEPDGEVGERGAGVELCRAGIPVHGHGLRQPDSDTGADRRADGGAHEVGGAVVVLAGEDHQPADHGGGHERHHGEQRRMPSPPDLRGEHQHEEDPAEHKSIGHGRRN
ncbi:glycosyltransferase family 87 protein [Amycolatopsis minnesotensis]|uniref:Alpha-1,2-mannosyltransferase n=1 Tax=Amycolatopsis minnesotensis TaxID=337894 RepID=A0ABN2RL24_9PSEU